MVLVAGREGEMVWVAGRKAESESDSTEAGSRCAPLTQMSVLQLS